MSEGRDAPFDEWVPALYDEEELLRERPWGEALSTLLHSLFTAVRSDGAVNHWELLNQPRFQELKERVSGCRAGLWISAITT